MLGECKREITVKKIQKSWINPGVYDMIKNNKRADSLKILKA